MILYLIFFILPGKIFEVDIGNVHKDIIPLQIIT